MTRLRRSSSVVGELKPIRAAISAAISRKSLWNSRLANSHEAICQPAMRANPRTANPRMILAFRIATICSVQDFLAEEYALECLSSFSTPEGNRGVQRPQQWCFAPASRYLLDRFDLAIPHQQSTIEIVHRGANVPRKEIQRYTDLLTRGSFL